MRYHGYGTQILDTLRAWKEDITTGWVLFQLLLLLLFLSERIGAETTQLIDGRPAGPSRQSSPLLCMPMFDGRGGQIWLCLPLCIDTLASDKEEERRSVTPLPCVHTNSEMKKAHVGSASCPPETVGGVDREREMRGLSSSFRSSSFPPPFSPAHSAARHEPLITTPSLARSMGASPLLLSCLPVSLLCSCLV